jgi:serine O-acetyltransferase
MRSIRARQPRFVEAVLADARVAARRRSEEIQFESKARAFAYIVWLMWVSDAFFAHVMYRAKVALQVARVPVLPVIAHRLAMSTAQICIGDPVVMHPGVYIAHGQVVLDGLVEVGSGTVLFPWITIGLQAGNIQGPTIGERVIVGSGAKVVGPVRVGSEAKIGANAVVLHDVAPGSTVVGMPARVPGGLDEPRPT